MISFKRDGNKLICRVHDQITNTAWHFSHELKHKSEAEICKRHFRSEFEDIIKRIREHAYEQGYKDGKGHKKKVKTFYPTTNEPDKVGFKY